ncbi:hypothetical protein Poli38472_000272 [Pythium oligandrum]|uniref:Aspartyl/asparaginy/proline hydroxylase domain-containing protein n=1 Tax=Pythium oligandrum TaxID=41045 RepID=A0A8K1CCD9_PYTOL|nr:hypothetical protein Poli38472_000272 [Pythium oligandrum]|eukprot:TMW60230.1 hypothetical protein Poli38472_000272 [Pythium oligandrum]
MASTTSVKDFYEGLYHSPLFADHHLVTCNIGFESTAQEERHEELQGNTLRVHVKEYQDKHTPNDRSQLRLYEELLGMLENNLPDAVKQVYGGEALRESKLSVLDIGCGPGGGVCAMQALLPNAEFTGVDVSTQAIARSKANWRRFVKAVPELQHKRSPHWFAQDCEQLAATRTASVDIVCAVQCLQEVEHLSKALREIERVLRPGGFLLIADFIPSDNSRDRVYHELLEVATSPLTAESSLWEVKEERLASSNALRACKLNSSRAQKLIGEFIPEEFRPDMETLFFVENSKLYCQLERGEMGYQLVCLQKKVGPGETSFMVALHEHDDEDVHSEYSEEEDSHDEEEERSAKGPIYDADLPNFYSYAQVFPQLEVLKENYDVILEEMLAVQAGAAWPFWPEKHYKEEQSEWRVFPFCYTFPAYDASRTTWVDHTCSLCPRTVEILRSIPGIRTALFSKLGPQTKLNAHRGWADLSNHILRCHLGLIVPTLEDGKPTCAMVVGGEESAHKERDVLVFDDSKLHYAFNNHPEKTRHVLIVDLYRPDYLPRGRARGGHTDELDEFIETFGKQGMFADN